MVVRFSSVAEFMEIHYSVRKTGGGKIGGSSDKRIASVYAAPHGATIASPRTTFANAREYKTIAAVQTRSLAQGV